MPEYIFAYHGGKKPETEEQGQKEMQRWSEWFEKIGGSVVNPGNPVGMSKTVSASGVADDGGANPLSGYTVVKAEDIGGAVEMAKGCPILDHGSVEVAEIMEM